LSTISPRAFPSCGVGQTSCDGKTVRPQGLNGQRLVAEDRTCRGNGDHAPDVEIVVCARVNRANDEEMISPGAGSQILSMATMAPTAP
jgi:hypothetical protein